MNKSEAEDAESHGQRRHRKVAGAVLHRVVHTRKGDGDVKRAAADVVCGLEDEADSGAVVGDVRIEAEAAQGERDRSQEEGLQRTGSTVFLATGGVGSEATTTTRKNMMRTTGPRDAEDNGNDNGGGRQQCSTVGAAPARVRCGVRDDALSDVINLKFDDDAKDAVDEQVVGRVRGGAVGEARDAWAQRH